MNGKALPPWAPEHELPSALVAPRGGWLHFYLSGGGDSAGMRSQRAVSDAATYQRWPANAVTDMFGGAGARVMGGQRMVEFREMSSSTSAQSSAQSSWENREVILPRSGSSTPHVSVHEAQDAERLDSIMHGISPTESTASPHVSPVNFVNDSILELPKAEFQRYLESIPPETAAAVRSARRRKKNREYARGSRQRRRERAEANGNTLDTAVQSQGPIPPRVPMLQQPLANFGQTINLPSGAVGIGPSLSPILSPSFATGSGQSNELCDGSEQSILERYIDALGTSNPPQG